MDLDIIFTRSTCMFRSNAVPIHVKYAVPIHVKYAVPIIYAAERASGSHNFSFLHF